MDIMEILCLKKYLKSWKHVILNTNQREFIWNWIDKKIRLVTHKKQNRSPDLSLKLSLKLFHIKFLS